MLHLPSTKLLWLNTYFPTDPQNIGNYDDTDLLSCLTEVETILKNTSYSDVVWGSDINWDMSRNTKFAKTVSEFLKNMELVPLWKHLGNVSYTFEQVCKNGRVAHSTVDHFLLSPDCCP